MRSMSANKRREGEGEGERERQRESPTFLKRSNFNLPLGVGHGQVITGMGGREKERERNGKCDATQLVFENKIQSLHNTTAYHHTGGQALPLNNATHSVSSEHSQEQTLTRRLGWRPSLWMHSMTASHPGQRRLRWTQLKRQMEGIPSQQKDKMQLSKIASCKTYRWATCLAWSTFKQNGNQPHCSQKFERH